jgi:hypothetical protein
MMVKVVKLKRKKVASRSKSTDQKRVLLMSQQITLALLALILILSTLIFQIKKAHQAIKSIAI